MRHIEGLAKFTQEFDLRRDFIPGHKSSNLREILAMMGFLVQSESVRAVAIKFKLSEATIKKWILYFSKLHSFEFIITDGITTMPVYKRVWSLDVNYAANKLEGKLTHLEHIDWVLIEKKTGIKVPINNYKN